MTFETVVYDTANIGQFTMYSGKSPINADKACDVARILLMLSGGSGVIIMRQDGVMRIRWDIDKGNAEVQRYDMDSTPK
jgi:hypothetical protein